jgi:hypothetical protein
MVDAAGRFEYARMHTTDDFISVAVDDGAAYALTRIGRIIVQRIE